LVLALWAAELGALAGEKAMSRQGREIPDASGHEENRWRRNCDFFGLSATVIGGYNSMMPEFELVFRKSRAALESGLTSD